MCEQICVMDLNCYTILDKISQITEKNFIGSAPIWNPIFFSIFDA